MIVLLHAPIIMLKLFCLLLDGRSMVTYNGE